MNALTRSLTLALLVTAPLAVQAGTDAEHGPHYPDVVSLERGIETASDLVLLPGSESGTLTVNQCAGCRAITLTVNAQTRYFLGAQQMTLAQLKSRLAGGRSISMMVFAALKEPIALRVVADRSSGAPAQAH
jgi:hypothetical protein